MKYNQQCHTTSVEYERRRRFLGERWTRRRRTLISIGVLGVGTASFVMFATTVHGSGPRVTEDVVLMVVGAMGAIMCLMVALAMDSMNTDRLIVAELETFKRRVAELEEECSLLSRSRLSEPELGDVQQGPSVDS